MTRTACISGKLEVHRPGGAGGAGRRGVRQARARQRDRKWVRPGSVRPVRPSVGDGGRRL